MTATIQSDAAAAAPAPPPAMTVTPGTAQQRDPAAADYLDHAEVSMNSLVMGLFDNSDDCIKMIHTDGSLQLMNCNGRQAMEVDDFEALRGARWADLWPEESKDIVRQSVDEALAGKRVRFEAFCPTAKGTPRWWEVTVAPISDPAGKVSALLSSSRDITDRVQREQALESVAKEMRHRLRNAFAVSAAIATASAREMPEHKDFANDVSRRLGRLAEAQASLLDLDGLVPLDDLVRRVLKLDGGIGAAIEVADLPDIMLGESAAKALALVLGEQATNSLKYGAIGSSGTVRVGGTLNDGRLILDWHERRGAGAPVHDGRLGSSGQGGIIMERMLRSVNGAMTGGVTETGYSARIEIGDWRG